MSRIPADVERLMWLVAEEGNPRAIEEFEERFPHLKSELAKRRSMVRGLKGAKRQALVPPSIPAFRPRNPAPTATPRLTWAVAAIALGALAFASYKLTASTVAKPEPLAPGGGAGGRIIEAPPKTTMPPPTSAQEPKTTAPQKIDQPAGSSSGAPEDEKPPYLKPITLKMEHVPLKVVLSAIEQQSSMHLEIGPGMPDPTIDADFDGQTAVAILGELGRQYGFTAFDQGNGSIVIVPATDRSGSTVDKSANQRGLGP